MSRCAPPADDTLVYQSVHSTPPRRPSAGVSRYDTLPLTMLSRTPTDSSAISAGPISPQEVAAYTSSRWPWITSSVDSDDREKTALVAGKGSDTQEVTMKPWEGWRVVLLGSWFNVLLLLLPASWIIDFLSEKSRTIVFTFSILSMVPLVKLHDLQFES
ncbi:hypothetical protein BC826DRAFT_1108007 [Russula brevipes]|nr:hypothetical protein BC826DRAFT_1108007 [Russula brevipes]